jgi:hypothetical protein
MGHMSEFDGPVTVSDSVTGVDPTQMNKARALAPYSVTSKARLRAPSHV